MTATPGTTHGVRLAVDAMGGDHGPAEVVPGALHHARAHPEDLVLLVGDPARIQEHAAGALPPNVEIVPVVVRADALDYLKHPFVEIVRQRRHGDRLQQVSHQLRTVV